MPSSGTSIPARKWPTTGSGPKLSIHRATSSAPASEIVAR